MRRRCRPEIAHLERRKSPFLEPRQELGNVAVCLAVEGMKRGVSNFLGLVESCVEVIQSHSRLSRLAGERVGKQAGRQADWPAAAGGNNNKALAQTRGWLGPTVLLKDVAGVA